MNVSTVRALPAIKEHWPQIAHFVDAMLVEQLVQTCAGMGGGVQTPERAAAENGAAKALAAQIILFRSLGATGGAAKPVTLKPLRRNSREKPKDGQATPKP